MALSLYKEISTKPDIVTAFADRRVFSFRVSRSRFEQTSERVGHTS